MGGHLKSPRYPLHPVGSARWLIILQSSSGCSQNSLYEGGIVLNRDFLIKYSPSFRVLSASAGVRVLMSRGSGSLMRVELTSSNPLSLIRRVDTSVWVSPWASSVCAAIPPKSMEPVL